MLGFIFLVSIPSSSLAIIKLTKSIARAAIYEGLNAVSTVFNNNDLQIAYQLEKLETKNKLNTY